MKDSNKFLLISVAFLFFYLGLGVFNFSQFGLVNNSIDFDVHWKMVRGIDVGTNYPDTYAFIFQFFSFSQLFFYGINLLIICLIIPFLLFIITKTHWSAILYFCGGSLPHVWIYGSTFPQVLVFMLVLVYLANRKNPFVYVLAGVIASLIHREGIYLFGLILFAEVIDFIVRKYLGKRLAPAFVLGVQKFNDIWQFLFYLLTQISLPLWFFAKNIFLNPFYLVLAVVPLFLLNYDARIISVTQIALVLFVSPQIAKSKHKKWIGFILFFYLLFFLLEFAVGTTKLFF